MRVSAPLFIHYVRDMSSAVEFYRESFGVKTLEESPGWTTLDLGDAVLALHILGSNMSEGPIPHAGLCLLVESIEDMRTNIESLGGKMTELREPDEFVPVRVASFLDPDGNGFDLRQNP